MEKSQARPAEKRFRVSPYISHVYPQLVKLMTDGNSSQLEIIGSNEIFPTNIFVSKSFILNFHHLKTPVAIILILPC